MRIGEVMARRVQFVGLDDSVRDAAACMRELDVGALPVVEDGRLLGMVTDRDITVRATAFGMDPKRVRVRQAMSRGVIYCYEDDHVRDVAQVMKQRQIRRMPVVDRDGRLLGIVTLGDLAVRARDDRLTGDILEGVSRPTQGSRAVNGMLENGVGMEDNGVHWSMQGRGVPGFEAADSGFRPGLDGIGSEFPGGVGRQWGQGQSGMGRPRPWGEGQRPQWRGPKNYTRSDDRIREDLCDRLAERHDIDVGEVMVRVQNGEVTIEGTAIDRRHKYVIEQIADAVPGVKDVSNQIRLKRADGGTEIARQNGGRDKSENQQPRQDTTTRR